MVKVHSPVPGINKRIAGVSFVNGTADVDPGNIAALRYFQRHGYRIDSGQHEQSGEPDADGELDLEEMSVPELRAYAKAHNIDVKGFNSKADIRNAIEVALTADQDKDGDPA